MDTKSLGNIAYDAYCAATNWKSVYTGADLPQYDQQRPEVIAAWEAAGVAVAATICSVKVAESESSKFEPEYQYGVTEGDSNIPTTTLSAIAETVNNTVDEESAPDETYAIKA